MHASPLFTDWCEAVLLKTHRTKYGKKESGRSEPWEIFNSRNAWSFIVFGRSPAALPPTWTCQQVGWISYSDKCYGDVYEYRYVTTDFSCLRMKASYSKSTYGFNPKQPYWLDWNRVHFSMPLSFCERWRQQPRSRAVFDYAGRVLGRLEPLGR